MIWFIAADLKRQARHIFGWVMAVLNDDRPCGDCQTDVRACGRRTPCKSADKIEEVASRRENDADDHGRNEDALALSHAVIFQSGLIGWTRSQVETTTTELDRLREPFGRPQAVRGVVNERGGRPLLSRCLLP